jgi:nucleotide-binding universal stress UspA family protein
VSARPIVCAYDASAPARRAAEVAAWLAAQAGVPLELLYVLDEGALPSLGRHGAMADPVLRGQVHSMQDDRARLWARRELQAAAAALTGVGATYSLHDGRPVPVLLTLAAERRAELLVSGTAARVGLEHMLLGSVSADLAAQSPCPLVVVAPDAVVGDSGPLLFGDDGSEHAARAARHAVRIAALLGRDVVTITADAGDPATAIAEAARSHRACLILLGTRGRGPVRANLLGSVSTALVQTADRPVALVPATAGDPA